MKLLKLGILTMVMGFFIISCGNKNNGNTNTSDSTMNTVTDTSGSSMASPIVPDTTQHPNDNMGSTPVVDTGTQPVH